MDSADTRSRLRRRLIWIGILGTIVILACFRLLHGWQTDCPARLHVVGLSPSGICAPRASDFRVLYVVPSNHSHAQVSFKPDTVRFEARARGRWVPALRAPPPTADSAGGLSGIPILVPAGADACRMRFTYHYWGTETLEQRIFRTFPRLSRTPVIQSWLRRRSQLRLSSPQSSVPHWLNGITPTVLLPKEPDRNSWTDDPAGQIDK